MDEYIEAFDQDELSRFRGYYRGADLLAIDDIHNLAGNERSQEEFFHTFEAIYKAGRQLVIASDRSPGEMNEIAEAGTVRAASDALTDKIFDRFDIVIGARLDLLYPVGVIAGEIVNDVVQHILHDRRQWRQLANARLVAQGLQPANLHQHAKSNQSVFAEQAAETADFAGITTVGRRQCPEICKVH